MRMDSIMKLSNLWRGFIRRCRLVITAMVLGLMTAGSVSAQTPPPVQAQTAPAAQSQSAPDSDTEAAQSSTAPASSPENEATAADIKAKLEALEAAEQDFLKAAREQAASSGDTPTAEVETPDTPAKPSLIPKNAEDAKALARSILDKIIGWLTSVTFLAQVGAIVVIWFLAPLLTKMLTKRVFLFNEKPAKDVKFRVARDYVYRSREFLRAALQVVLLSLAAVILKNSLGQDWLVRIAQGLAVVFLLYSVIKTFVTNELFQKIAIWVAIPLALLMVFGLYDDLTNWLNSVKFGQGENAITAMTLVMLAIFGAVFFKIATYSNVKGQDAIRAQEALDVTTREVIAKIFQIVIFVAATMMAFTAAGISLSGLVVIFSALSLGIGLGLQPIAANFVSGLIILFDRSVKVGDFVMMEDEKFGRVKAINMRSTTVATADGKDIIVPNTQFTEGAYENWTHDSPLQRYEVDFGVAYDTDLDALVPIIRDAVLAHEDVLGEPDLPSVEFRSFGDSSINMCVEFWCMGVDDGPNKFTSDVGFIIWRTLKANNITIPFPQRDVRVISERGSQTPLAPKSSARKTAGKPSKAKAK